MAPAVVGAARANAPSAEAPAEVALLDDTQRELRDAVARCAARSRPTPTTSAPSSPKSRARSTSATTPERAIRGQATPAEVEALMEEGVDVLPIPAAPDEFN